MASSARIEELERKFNENPRRYFAPLANEYRKAGDLQQAIAICRTYVPQQPAHMSGHIVFGQALFESGELDEARGVFEAALSLDPENLIALRHLGDIARSRHEISAARSWYQRVLDADPRNDEITALVSSLDAAGLSSRTPVSVAAHGGDENGATGWGEINPEQTLELPTSFVESDEEYTPTAAAPAAPAAPADPAAPTPRDSASITLEAPPVASSEPVAHEDDSPSAIDPTPEAFITETMAELYLQQGFRPEALDVYRQLLARDPRDPTLRERVEELERELAAAAEPVGAGSTASAASAPSTAPSVGAEATARTARAFFSALAMRRVAGQSAEASGASPADTPSDTTYTDDTFDHAVFGAEAFTELRPPPVRRPSMQFEYEQSAEMNFSGSAEFHDTASFDTGQMDAVAPAPVESAEGEAPRVESDAPPHHDPSDADDPQASAPRRMMQTGSVNVLFAEQRGVESGDEAAAATLSSAFGGPSSSPQSGAGETAAPSAPAARPARDELSLDRIFRDDDTETYGSSAPSSADVERAASAFSFDQFFGEEAPGLQQASGSSDASHGEGDAAGTNPNGVSDDFGLEAEQFTDWLSGLKKK